MALLNYSNLNTKNYEWLSKQTFYGLLTFENFLVQNKKFLTGENKVIRIGWERVDQKYLNQDLDSEEETGVWIQLKEFKGMKADYRSTSKFFLDQSNRFVLDDNGKVPFNARKLEEIKIIKLDVEQDQIKLSQVPSYPLIALKPNTYTIDCQLKAVRTLRDQPTNSQLPLLKLFEAYKDAEWPEFVTKNSHEAYQDPVLDWYVLKDSTREGTDQQRLWVNIALNTPDFAFLDGPPGSGKTTAICELVIQLCLRGKRVLLTASTHVAIDNVLERIMHDDIAENASILAIRIGTESILSPKVRPWLLSNFLKTEKDRLLKKLNQLEALSDAQQDLLTMLHSSDESIQTMILDSANVVCGTTIGILQHPVIKKNRSLGKLELFDFMIVDESSKTTFQEFLVPALFAKRWILVGDPKQLSPFIDEKATEANFQQCLPEAYKREACLDVFQALNPSLKHPTTTMVVTSQENVKAYYGEQAKAKDVLVGTSHSPATAISYAGVVVADSNFAAQQLDNLPLDIAVIRGEDQAPEQLIRSKNAYRSRMAKIANHKFVNTSWENEIAWRQSRLYELRQDALHPHKGDSKKKLRGEKLLAQLDQLLPFDIDQVQEKKKGKPLREKLEEVIRVAYPSILESLKNGFGKVPGSKKEPPKKAITHGLPSVIFANRSVALTWQHRMHPDIAAFPSQHIYHGKALVTPSFMAEARNSTYKPQTSSLVWVNVRDKSTAGNINRQEVKAILQELENLYEWAKDHPNLDSKTGVVLPWEVAILTFYRGQENELIKEIKRNSHSISYRHYAKGDKERPNLLIQIGTVDSFQGKEADFVLLSFVKQYPTSFLESPNRLNVAITRAKYKMIVYGNRKALEKSNGLLGLFAKDTPWQKQI